MIKRLFILFAVIAGTLLSIHAQDIPDPMTPKRIVNDFTGLFSTQEQAALEKKLVNFNNNSSTQIAVVTVADLDGSDISDYSARLFDKWGIGGGYQSGTQRTAMACQAGFDYSYGYPAHLHGHSYYHCFVEGKTDIDAATKQSPVVESYSDAAYAAAGRPAGFERDQAPGAKTPQWRRPAPNEEVRFVYDTDLFTAKAKSLIRAHQEGPAKDAPFFLHLCYTTVHGSGNRQVADPAIACTLPFQVPGGPYPALSDDPATGGGAVLGDPAIKGTADTANTWIHPDFRGYKTPSQRRYATTVRRLDDAIGDLLRFLRLRGLERDTLFVFTSDEVVQQEIALYKVTRSRNVEQLVRRHNVRILEIDDDYIVVEKTGYKSETRELFELLQPYGVQQFVRSGTVAIVKSRRELLNEYLEELARNDRKLS